MSTCPSARPRRRSVRPGDRADRLLRAARRMSSSDSGLAAVEFSLIAPLLVTLLLSLIGFGQIISVNHGLQQLAAESARASVAGINDPERETLVRQFIASNAGGYIGLDAARIQVSISTVAPPQNATAVQLSYDLSDTLIYRLAPSLLPDPAVRRSAAIQRGGY